MNQTHVSLRVSVATVALAWAAIAVGQAGPIDVERAPRLRAGPPVNFGTTQESFLTVGAWEFDPFASEQTYTTTTTVSFNFVRYLTGGGAGGGDGFIAGTHLPDGAVVTSVIFHLCDSNASDLHTTALVAVCTALDGICQILGDPIVTSSSIVTPCAAYTQDLSGLNYFVDNQTSRLVLIALPGERNATTTIAGGVVGYKLQVSPPPITNTFGDVLPNHQFFQFIEALAKSGITGGCGGGNYCPDNPLTRGQMAVFLAKALGLQFP